LVFQKTKVQLYDKESPENKYSQLLTQYAAQYVTKQIVEISFLSLNSLKLRFGFNCMFINTAAKEQLPLVKLESRLMVVSRVAKYSRMHDYHELFTRMTNSYRMLT